MYVWVTDQTVKEIYLIYKSQLIETKKNKKIKIKINYANKNKKNNTFNKDKLYCDD